MHDSEKAPVSLKDLCGLASLAGDIMKAHFRHYGMDRVVKDDGTPVTPADIEINRLVIDHIRALSPDIDIVGEEESDRRDSPWQLTCDPIDGTFPYAWGMPVATCMLGLMYEYRPVMGVIYDPFMHRLFTAEQGQGAWLNGQRLDVAKPLSMNAGLVPAIGFASWPNNPEKEVVCRFNLLRVCQYLDQHGIGCLNIWSIGYFEAAVATGHLVGCIFPGHKTHDTVPGHIIVEEAGGKVTDVFGNPIDYSADQINGHIMSNGVATHELLVEAVRACNCE